MYTIEVQGLDETIAQLRELDGKLASDLKREIKGIAQPTLSKAKGFAGGVGSFPTGRYAASLSLRTYANGVKFVSNDPGGGVIEFANPGALILTGERAGRRAGVPVGSNPPRALLKAILEDEEHIVEKVNEKVVEYCDWDVGSIHG